MTETNTLADFRSRWVRELVQRDANDKVPHHISATEVRAGESIKSIKRDDAEDDVVVDADNTTTTTTTSTSTNSSVIGKQTSKRVLDDSWDGSHDAKRKSNTLTPFLIAENLLKGGRVLEASQTPTVSSGGGSVGEAVDEVVNCPLHDDSVGAGTTCHGVSLTCMKCRKSRNFDPKDRRGFCRNKLLDVFLDDLNEINDIPFFDLEVSREVAITIFKHLDVQDLCRCAQVSKAWRSLAEDEFLWNRISHQLGFHQREQVVDKQNWKLFVTDSFQNHQTLEHNWMNRVAIPRELLYEMGGVLCAATSHQNLVAVGYNCGEVRLWDVREDDEWTLQPSSTALVLDEQYDYGTLPNYVTCLAMNASHTIAGYSQGFVDIWKNVGDKSPVHTWRCRTAISAICCAESEPLCVVANGSQLQVKSADAGSDGGWSIVNNKYYDETISSVKLISRTPGALRDSHHVIAVALRDQVKVHRPTRVDGSDQEVTLYHAMGHPVSCIDGDAATVAVAMSAYDDLNNVYKLRLYDLAKGQEGESFKGHQWTIRCVNLLNSPPHMFVTGCADKKVRVYDRRQGDVTCCLLGHTSAVRAVQMDETKVVSGADDGLLCVWDQRCATRLWDVHNRHPVTYLHFGAEHLIFANIPKCQFPITDDEPQERMVHRRYRGSLSTYNFNISSDSENIPGICRSAYTQPSSYSYNIRLAMPYDDL